MFIAKLGDGEGVKQERLANSVVRWLDADNKPVRYEIHMDEAPAREWLAKHGILKYEAAPEEFWAEIFAAGEWTDSQGYKDQYTTADLDSMVVAFEATREQIKVPLRIGAHAEDIAPAGGWVTGLRRVGDKLLARFSDMPAIVREALGKRLFKQVSSGIDFNREVGGKKWPRLLNHVALLGARLPAVKGLQDLQAYFGDLGSSHQIMFEYDDDKLIPPQEEDKMSAELMKLMQDQLTAVTAKQATFEEEQRKLTARNAELERENAESKRLLQEQKDNAAKAAKEAALATIKTYCEDKVKAGQMAPAVRDALVGAVTFMDGKPVVAWDQVRELADKGAKLDTKEHGRAGDNKTGELTFTEAIKKAQAANPKLSYDEATRIVRMTQPDLAREFDESLQNGKED